MRSEEIWTKAFFMALTNGMKTNEAASFANNCLSQYDAVFNDVVNEIQFDFYNKDNQMECSINANTRQEAYNRAGELIGEYEASECTVKETVH